MNSTLIPAHPLETAEVRARDGLVGRLDDLLFDDAGWTVRYLVIDTGVWLAGRRVLIAPSAVSGHADDTNCVSVSLSRDQIRSSPQAGPSEEVTREHEQELHEHYRWPAYWSATSTPLAGDVVPPPAFIEPPPQERPPQSRRAAQLRSARHVRGYRLAATDGAIGVLEDFLLEPRTWRIAFLVVDTNGWLPGGKVLLEPHTIDRVSWTEAKIFVHEERAVVKAHPPYSPDSLLDPDYLAGLQRHYQHPPMLG
jgi:hypothetical protein